MVELATLIEKLKAGMARAEAAGIHLPNGMTLATVADGRPSARVVLLKQASESGLDFYTNLQSRKARELAENDRASLCFWWGPIEEQVRVEGRVVAIPDNEADAYHASRPRGSQLAAWTSRQSEPLQSRDHMLASYSELSEKYEGETVPRPPFWGGFRMLPDYFEFWFGQPDRLHERESYRKEDSGWSETLLYP